MKRIVITGGHHSSALPVIRELKQRYPKIEIYWFGHKHALFGNKNLSLEYREISELGIPFYDLKAGKFYRAFNPLKIIKIPFGFLQSLYFLMIVRPEAILSFGGYLAVPVVLSGKILGIKSITHEQTVVLGYANKLISKFVDRVVYAWPQSEIYFPKEKSTMVGLPLRNEIFEVKSDIFEVKESLPTIYITAGKTGSHLINQAIENNLEEFLAKFNLIHQTGDYSKYNDYQKLQNKYKLIRNKVVGNYYPEKFIFGDNIGEVFSKADLIISRSGAHICYEVLALNKPAIFIPLPNVSHNEQYENASKVKELGLAEIFSQADLSQNNFLEFILDFVKNIDKYKLSNNNVVVKNSSQKIVDELEKILKA